MPGCATSALVSRSSVVTACPRSAKNRLWRPRPAATSRTVAPGAIRPAHCTIQDDGEPLASATIAPHHLWHSPRGSANSGISRNFMILYRLRCSKGHEFESWFKDSKTYERQEKKSLIGCAVCGDSKVARAVMSPRIGKAGKGMVEAEAQTAPAPAAASIPTPQQLQMAALAKHVPKEMRETLLKLREQ